MCYVTLRGLVYFGASIHVYHGVQMLVNMYYDLFSTTATKDQAQQVTHIDIIFNCCFLSLGILIFRGVEQKSKSFIKWPTIGFTLLLAFRFIVEIIKQVQRERNGGMPRLKPSSSISPFSYSSMSIDVDPLISAAVGIYIFILFVYNHSLEYDHAHEMAEEGQRRMLQQSLGGGNRTSASATNSDDASSDTVLLINHHHHHNNGTQRPSGGNGSGTGDSNNNTGSTSSHSHPLPHPHSLRLSGGGLNNMNIINTRANPLFELDRANINILPHQGGGGGGGVGESLLRHQNNVDHLLLMDEQISASPPTPPEYKVDAV